MQKDGSARWGCSYDDAKFAVLDDHEEEDDENDGEGDDRTQSAQHQDRKSEVPPLADENADQQAVDRGAVSSSSQLFPSLSPADRLLIEEACRTPSAASTVHSSDRIANAKHPRRPRALSYDAGLAEWTVRLKRYSQSDDEYDPDGADNNNDASGTSLALGEALGESTSSTSGAAGFGLGPGLGSASPSTSGGGGGLAMGGTAALSSASPSTAGEDRGKAQTAMERIRNKRNKRAGAIAAAANNGPGRDSSANAANTQQHQQKYRPDQMSSGRRQQRRRRKRSASEPPPLVRTATDFKAEANITSKTKNGIFGSSESKRISKDASFTSTCYRIRLPTAAEILPSPSLRTRSRK